MITFSTRHSFEWMVASGALGFNGQGWPWEKPLVRLGLVQPRLFTVVLKTLTFDPRRGNLCWWKPFECVWPFFRDGAVNMVGLTNPGFYWWDRMIAPHLDFERFPIVVSIFGNTQELITMAENLNNHEGLRAIEVNASCPNTGHRMDTTTAVVESVSAVAGTSHFPVIAKVSVDQDYLAIAEGLKGIAEAIALNSVPWSLAFPNGEQSPLWRLQKRVGGGGGGVSGRPAQAYNWRAVQELAKQKSLPVIGPSVMNIDDVHRVRELGASAVSFGAIHLLHPWRPTSIVKKMSTVAGRRN